MTYHSIGQIIRRLRIITNNTIRLYGNRQPNHRFFTIAGVEYPRYGSLFYKQQIATLTAPRGFAQYTWNNQGSGQTYTATQPGTVTLTVTDANGCQVTQRIQVADLCPK